MKELFSSSETAWVLPLLTVCTLIILLAAWALRRDIAQFFKNFFFPKEQRYTLSQPILKQGQSQRAASNAPQKDIIPQAKGDYVPSQFTIIDKAQFTSNLQKYKPPKDIFNVIATMTTWYWRKIKRFFGAKQAAPAPARTKAEAVTTANLIAPEESKPAAPRHKVMTGERVLFFFIMVVLALFIIFLGARVSKLSNAVEEQNNYIRDMRHPQQKRVVIYDIPTPKK